jgi:hypothetical protein
MTVRMTRILPFPCCFLAVLACLSCGSSRRTTGDGSDLPDWTVPDAADMDGTGEPIPCPEGQASCGGECVDLASDPRHCGACDNPCGDSRECVEGECLCLEGLTVCGGSCVNTNTDPLHCGGCNNACEEGLVCSNGRCSLVCDEGLTNCGGACVDIMTDLMHCGGCFEACGAVEGANAQCTGGSCEYPCLPDHWDVDGEPGCEYECIFAAEEDTCNGIDDNCSGAIDEDFPCYPGEEVECSTICDSIGTGYCTDACQPPEGEACLPPEEACNGRDDDCDGLADDDFECVQGASVFCVTPCGSTGTGTCTTVCTIPPAASCTPPAESCNGADDDCDGTCDNGYSCCLGTSGVSCTNPVGVSGTRSCGAGCEWSACCAASETCGNGFDDNCNGTVDDGCAVCGDCRTDPPEQCDDCNADNTDACKTTCVHVWENARQLYCNGTCSWAGGSGCDQADADIFCKLKTRNPASTASSWSTTTALAEEGFSCPGIGRNLGPFTAYGVSVNVWYQTTSILANHGAGTVVHNITCTNP